MKNNRLLFIIVLFALFITACGPGAVPAETVALKIAVLPIIDTLPLYVAQQQGFFAKHGVEVELVPVASAPERVQLVASGQVDGTINETLSVMLFNKETIQMQAVRYALRPAEGYGHFFILASGPSGITAPEGFKGVEIGVSQGTIIEYVTERLLTNEGLSADEIVTIPVPKNSRPHGAAGIRRTFGRHPARSARRAGRAIWRGHRPGRLPTIPNTASASTPSGKKSSTRTPRPSRVSWPPWTKPSRSSTPTPPSTPTS